MQILNRLGAVASNDTHARYMEAIVEKRNSDVATQLRKISQSVLWTLTFKVSQFYEPAPSQSHEPAPSQFHKPTLSQFHKPTPLLHHHLNGQ